jgi:Xaa-Pro aminopeptidase
MEFDLKGADALLVVGDSERNADLYYATRFRAPDPFVFLWTASERILMASDLEVDRSRAQAAVDRVVASSKYERQLRQQGTEQPEFDDVVLALLREIEVKKLLVPTDFPLGTGDGLRRAGLFLDIAPRPLFPGRQIKTEEEVEAVRLAQEAAEQGMEVAIDAIRRSEARDGLLFLEGEVLTSERLRRLVHLTLMERDCTAQHTIIAGGEQGCDPHQVGSGPLRAGETIIIDIFPQSSTSGYFGDITRTVVKGPVPEAIRQLYETVLRGQQQALEQIRAGADGRRIHQEILDLFTEAGYATGEKDGRMQGFFHGTGHGVGLEIHESPRIGSRGDTLQAGQVVTVEPGLYYLGLGGVRIEDTVVVREEGCQNLTTYPKLLEV